MLQRIHVDGFRSLQDFTLDLRPGLNVLIGPNGAGKSNVLRFLEFASFLTRTPLAEAVSRSGGAGEIFYRLASDKISQRISFTLYGSHKWSEDDEEDEHGDIVAGFSTVVSYQIFASISISADFTTIFFDTQRVSFAVEDGDSIPEQFNMPSAWDFDVESTSTADGEYRIVTHQISSKSKIVDDDFSMVVKSDMMRAVRDRLIFEVISYSVPALRELGEDFSSGQPFNINPARVREPEDIAEAAFIRPDGRGLASTLFSLRRVDQDYSGFYPFAVRRRRNSRPELLQEIKDYVRLVNDNIIDIDVKNDTFDNKLKVYTTMRSEGREIVIPLSLLSDGTVKWLSLVTSILTGRSIFSLEEPENFLHPRMQIEIIGMIRDAAHKQIDKGFAILTTHSETILNYLDPDEVVLTTMELSRTEAKRIGNASALREQIRDTGFGLGFFYVTGTI